MIYYFSGTGNSEYVARRLGCILNSGVKRMTDCIQPKGEKPFGEKEFSEALGLVFPVYAWGMPKVVERFVRQIPDAYDGSSTPYIYMVCTCGDDIGRTDCIVRKALQKKGYRLSSVWSVRMPNTYTALPGFDVDGSDVAEKKLDAAKARVEEIGHAVLSRQEDVHDVFPGRFPWMKSYVLRPLFNRFLTGDRKFRVSTSCVGCGKCAKVCPLGNVALDGNHRPHWSGNCTTCMACYHHCPSHSIGWGRATRNKGQYVLPQNMKDSWDR